MRAEVRSHYTGRGDAGADSHARYSAELSLQAWVLLAAASYVGWVTEQLVSTVGCCSCPSPVLNCRPWGSSGLHVAASDCLRNRASHAQLGNPRDCVSCPHNHQSQAWT